MTGGTQERQVLISSLYPLGGNYGGILQAFALQRVIRALGYEVFTVNSEVSRLRLRPVLAKIYVTGRAVLHRKPVPVSINRDSRKILWSATSEFIDTNIQTVDLFGLPLRQRRLLLRKFHAVVVGSDQVWRRPYAELSRQFLLYAYGLEIRRISYAASFGKADLNEYSIPQLIKARLLLRQFKSLSVREDSGVMICRDELKLAAEHHVDPTMLLERQDYVDIIGTSPNDLVDTDGFLFSYILDHSSWIKAMTKGLANEMHLELKSFLSPLPSTPSELRDATEAFKLRPVESYLSGIRDASYVVTDSFHGTVFSIIFNKPFVVIRNSRRGSARIDSLLRTFGLEDRAIENGTRTNMLLDLKDPDWGRVNAILLKERLKGISYLKGALR